MKFAVLFLMSLISFSSIAAIETVRVVENVTPSSYTCYTAEEEAQNNYESSINFSIGKFVDDGNGNISFNSSFYTSKKYFLAPELCMRLQFSYRSIDNNLSSEEKAISLLVNVYDKVVGFQDPGNNNLIFISK